MSGNSKKSMTAVISLFFFALLLSGTLLYIFANQMDEQSKKYLSINEDYTKDHSGQILVLYPWKTASPVKILPFDFVVPAAPENNLSIRMCPDQFESATFVINAQDDISDIMITASDLYNAHGARISSDEVNIRLVKVWYQACAADVYCPTRGYFLTPELLLKDDSLVNVDYVNKINYLKVTIDGNQQYIDISNPGSIFPEHTEIYDSPVLKPFSMKKNENKQIWLTVHVPAGIPAGDYFGDIIIATPSEPPVLMNFTVTVLPFNLEASPLEYAIYYRGKMPSAPSKVLSPNSEFKTAQQYSSELRDMKDHGISYPTMYNEDVEYLATELMLREQSGLPRDHIYYLGLKTGNPADPDELENLANSVMQVKNIVSSYGYRDLYIFGLDEASGDVLRSERPAWDTVHQAGAKVFAACYTDAVDIVGDILDAAIIAGPLNTKQAASWHMNGKKIFSYANPQVGVENPLLYRNNFGVALWNAGYDGAMNYAYQHGYGNIWNDYDKGTEPNYRDHVFAYPTSNGVIDTIQWEGFREGVDDTRYVATLLKNRGDEASVRSMVAKSLSDREDATYIRNEVIDQILLSLQNESGTRPERGRSYPLSQVFTHDPLSEISQLRSVCKLSGTDTCYPI